MISPENYKWRVGRKLGRTIYAMRIFNKASDDDVFIGIMDDRYLAELIVREHNEKRNFNG